MAAHRASCAQQPKRPGACPNSGLATCSSPARQAQILGLAIVQELVDQAQLDVVLTRDLHRLGQIVRRWPRLDFTLRFDPRGRIGIEVHQRLDVGGEPRFIHVQFGALAIQLGQLPANLAGVLLQRDPCPAQCLDRLLQAAQLLIAVAQHLVLQVHVRQPIVGHQRFLSCVVALGPGLVAQDAR